VLKPPKTVVTHVRTNDSARLPITMLAEKKYTLPCDIIRTKAKRSWGFFSPTASTVPQNRVTRLTRRADENQHFRRHVRVVRVSREIDDRSMLLQNMLM